MDRKQEFEQRALELLNEIRQEQNLLLAVARRIDGRLKPRLARIEVVYNERPTCRSTEPGEKEMAPTAGPVTLTTAGQKTTASVLGFDQNGQPMPSTFSMPLAAWTIDDTSGAVVSSIDNGDGTDTVTAVANGNVNLTASLTTAEGLALTASQAVTVLIAAVAPVLSSIQVAFA